MRTTRYITTFAGIALLLLTNSCKKETLPPVRCFSFGGIIDFPSLSIPIDSIVMITISERNGRIDTGYHKNIDVDSSFLFGGERCGLFRYKVMVYNRNPNPVIYLRLSGDNKYFLYDTLRGNQTIEGTYVYR